MRTYSAALALAALGLGVWGCSHSGYTSSPGAPSPSPGTAVIIDVVAVNGSRSFSPNPATIPAGQMVIWHNVDTITHRIVQDDLLNDTGNLARGAFSAPMLIGGTGAYHCAVHPVMVGTIKGQ